MNQVTITLRLKDSSIELTIDEAKALHQQLDDLFHRVVRSTSPTDSHRKATQPAESDFRIPRLDRGWPYDRFRWSFSDLPPNYWQRYRQSYKDSPLDAYELTDRGFTAE